LDGVCYQKLKQDKLERFMCRPDHRWVHVPRWSDREAVSIGKGRVRVRGELVDGERVGGEVVDIAQWLDEIRERWGIQKKLEVSNEPEPSTPPPESNLTNAA
jgi:hypothetical protein